MEFFLVKALAFLRPVLSIHTEVAIASINMFELAAMVFTAMIAAAFAMRAAVRKDLNTSATDLVIVGFVFWCIAIYVIYMDAAKINVLGKFIIPPITYLVAKNVVPDRAGYRSVLWLLIVGSAVPLLLSAAMIIGGGGVESVNYWTGVPRYEGAYYGAHDLGHNAAFALMVVWVYVLLQRDADGFAQASPRWSRSAIALVVGAALFLLYMAEVRTSILGLFVFGAVLLVFYYKRIGLVIGIVCLVGVTFLASEDLQRRFLPESVQAEQERNFDWMNYGSNRPNIWSRQMSEFFSLPVDHQIAGIGIGSTLARQTGEHESVLRLDTHNDYLRVMVHTGIIGFLLFMALQLLILQRILRLAGASRWAFLALFAAVSAMNLVSNSYVSRFGLAQMLYLVLAYVELPASRLAASRQPHLVLGGASNIRPASR